MSKAELTKFIKNNYTTRDGKIFVKKPPTEFQEQLIEYGVFPASILKYARYVSVNASLLSSPDIYREDDDDDDRNVSKARFGMYGAASNRITKGDSEKTKLTKQIRALGERDYIPASWVNPTLSLVSSSTDLQMDYMNPLALMLGYSFIEAGRESLELSS